jgi:glycosyltransferase involved in cell wall biosynthesis
VRWHLVSGEYPPSCGGVGDYTARLASALTAAGDQVDVWVPGAARSSGAPAVHALPDVFGPRSRAMLAEHWRRDPAIVLLQYVPNALGARGANLPFCRWLVSQRRAGVDVRVMFHEPYFYFAARRPWRNALAIVQRRMAAALIRASTRLYYSSDTWHRYLKPYGASADALVLPIPSTVAAHAPAAAIANFRSRFAQDAGAVVGHFGTFGGDIARELLPLLAALVDADPSVNLALIGDGSDEFQRILSARAPAVAARCRATGRLDAESVAAALRACDLVVQTYPDGVTTRRTTTMAGLSNGVPVVTTDGSLTEPVWRETRAAVLMPVRDCEALVRAVRELLSCAAEQREQGERGAETYARHFSMEQTIRTLREEVGTEAQVTR